MATCTDDVKNGNETDVDCGGACPACATGRQCAVGADCAGGICDGNTCRAAASCFELKAADVSTSGLYTVDLDKAGPLPAQRVYCDMASEGGGWTLVFNHQIAGGYFANAAAAASSNEDDPTSMTYSILGKLDTLKRGDRFTFRINWPGYASRNVWSQTTNPTADVDVAGYQAIDVQVATNFWNGLELGNGTHGPVNNSSYLDGSVSSSNWYYAVGSYVVWHGGIPAADAVAGLATGVPAVQLWVQ